MVLVPLCCSVRSDRSELGGLLTPVVGERPNGTGKFAIRQTERINPPPSTCPLAYPPACE